MNMNPDHNIDATDYDVCAICGENITKDADSQYVKTDWEDWEGHATGHDPYHKHDPYTGTGWVARGARP